MKTETSPKVQAAKAHATAAQQRMFATLHELQHRIAPKTLARDAWDGAKSKGADLAEDAVDAVRKRPLAATGAVAAVAMFLAREPLMDLAGRLWNRRSGQSDDDEYEPLVGSYETMEANQ